MFPVYGGKCLSCKAVHNLVEKFSRGYSKVAGYERRDHPVEIAMEASVQWVENWIQADKRITRQCSNCTRVFPWLAYSIIHDGWKFRKVCTQWVLREPKDWEKMNWIGLSLQHLSHYADEGEDMLNRIVTGDESWMHHYQSKSKHASMQQKHPSSPSHSTKKFKFTSMPSAGKVMLTMFWDSQGVLLAHFQKRGKNVKSASYCEDLLMLRDAIRRKRPGQLARWVLLQLDNARPHTAWGT
jgi:hypothetical protein